MMTNRKDITEKKLMAYNDVFAGIFNSLVFYHNRARSPHLYALI